MKIYHGTTSLNLNKILKKGLIPRGKKKSNWEEFPSRHDLVYVSQSYPFYFGINSVKSEPVLVVEIDLEKLDKSLLLPDEDYISQAMSKKAEIKDIHIKIRDNIEMWQRCWEASLNGIGNCSYKGTIPVSAITRYCLFDFKIRPHVACAMLDPSISIMNYCFLGSKYRSIVSWMFGDSETMESEFYKFDLKSTDEFAKERREHWNKECSDRTGITIHNLIGR